MTDATTASDSAEGSSGSASAPSGGRSVLRFLRDLLVILLAALLVSFLVKTYLIRSFWIPSPSMTNTLQVDDHVIVDELVPRAIALHHGDVVVFRDPGGWLVGDPSVVPAATPHTPVARAASWVLGLAGLGGADRDDHLVKRVIGLPGDHVRCCNDLGQMSVNGVPLREPYLRLPPGTTAASAKAFSVTVPAGDLWVMGDNRNDSEDSRFHRDLPTRGFVPMADVTGRAIAISWPARRWTWLDDYGQVFRGVEDHGASG